jgi:hypothetical protein
MLGHAMQVGAVTTVEQLLEAGGSGMYCALLAQAAELCVGLQVVGPVSK